MARTKTPMNELRAEAARKRLDQGYQDACITHSDKLRARYDGMVEGLQMAGFVVLRDGTRHIVSPFPDKDLKC